MSQKPSTITTFTSRVDTIYAVSFVCIAPEYPELDTLVTPAQKKAVEAYLEEVKNKSERDRQIGKDKTGVFTGSYAKNPLTGELVPIWIADYVLAGYGTGAVMGVAGHDERDFEFAQKYGLDIKKSIVSVDGKDELDDKVSADYGILCNSGEFDGFTSVEAKKAITQKLESQEKGRNKVNYKFRDWVFSRQRYWGEPFPFEYIKTDD